MGALAERNLQEAAGHPGVVVGLERLSQAGKGQDLEGIREGHREEATLRSEGRKEKG
jgi:hypothetical protein